MIFALLNIIDILYIVSKNSAFDSRFQLVEYFWVYRKTG